MMLEYLHVMMRGVFSSPAWVLLPHYLSKNVTHSYHPRHCGSGGGGGAAAVGGGGGGGATQGVNNSVRIFSGVEQLEHLLQELCAVHHIELVPPKKVHHTYHGQGLRWVHHH